MQGTSEVTVIIPNYNGKQMLENCIRALERQTCRAFKLLVVDNGSTDGSTEISTALPDFEIISLKRNTGFCRAVNIGIRHTGTPYFILLNNDTEAEEHFVEALLAGIRRSKKIFSCSAQMLDFKKRDIIDNAGDYYLATGWARARGKGRPAACYETGVEIFSCCGGASIYRTKTALALGLFDERHFAYLEDVDLGYRAKIHGYRNRYIPEAKVYHIGSATTGTRYNEKKVFLAARNSVFVIYKNMPFVQLLLNLPFIAAGIVIKSCFFAGKGFLREYLNGIREGIANCFQCRKVRFKMAHLGHYIGIEAELLVNIFRVLKY